MAPVRAGLDRRPPIAGAILAGGSSRRFGTDKSLAVTPAGPLAGVALGALRSAGADPVVFIGGSAELSAALAIPSIPDRMPGEGPLAGLGTALSWASGVSRILVIPCDMPSITPAVLRSLVQAGDNATASVVSLGGQPHAIVGCWPTSRAATVNALLRSGERRMSSAVDTGPYVLVDVPESEVADADDPAELARLLNPDAQA